jgi:methanogenic corrinoid protein MtbC1
MSNDADDEPRYPIRAAVRRTRIPAATLRSWERRYGFPSPARTATARRLYSSADLQAIDWLKAQIETGVSIGQAVRWYQGGHRDGPSTIGMGPVDGDPLLASTGAVRAGSLESLAQQMIENITAYDEAGLERDLSAAFTVHPPDQVLTNVLVPVLYEIGYRWAAGQLAVTAEHFASNVFRRRLFRILTQQPVPNSGRPIVLACVPGEEHEIGLLMFAVFLRWESLLPLYLGANVPSDDLLSCLLQTEASAVCLSAVMTESASALNETAMQVARERPDLPIFAGGAGCADASPAADIRVLGNDLRGGAHVIAEAVRFGIGD